MMQPYYTPLDDAVEKEGLWRNRDVAQQLHSDRRVESHSAVKSSSMSRSGQFDVDTCLARMRRDKAAVARTSFDAAATAVLQALEREDDDDDELDASIQLPSVLQEWKHLEEARVLSLERAHDNKEVAKTYRATKAKTAPENTPDSKTPAKPKQKKSDAPKFTRNTPASSAAALDSRSTSSRAVLCTAANVAFEALTPPLPGHDVDIVDVPQNPAKGSTTSASVVNMGAVVLQAQTLGQRATSVAENASRRAAKRCQFRKSNVKPAPRIFQMRNPYAWKKPQKIDEDEDEDMEDVEDDNVELEPPYQPAENAVTDKWSIQCLPRLLSILKKGAGHAVYHDVEWSTRHGRIANLLEDLSRDGNFGPHLIVTTEPDVPLFSQEFRDLNSHLRLLGMEQVELLRALTYRGTPKQRRKLREHFSDATGLPEASFHVIVASYANFLGDFLHFCQVPFEVVVLDDGVSWMSTAQADPNSTVGTVWETAIWSSCDQRIGRAGSTYESSWDFSTDEFSAETLKNAWVGLTARHRIMTSSVLRVQQRASVDIVPVSGMVNFVAPHFADVVREEWDRSRISTDGASMDHFRKLLTRCMVVHDPDSDQDDMYLLSLQALNGELPPPDRSQDPEVPELIQDEVFVTDGKVASSRRTSLAWLGTPDRSWLRYELGTTSFQHIVEAMKLSAAHGHICEEIMTASSTTSSGAAGQVTGTLAYRFAIRCGRHFGSEQGLRQHLSALHAPPGTWLCRTCGSDCMTSQARTHHERSCGQQAGAAASTAQSNPAGATSTVGQGGRSSKSRMSNGPAGTVGKKKGSRSATPSQGPISPDDKDPDGSFRVPGYRGVWVNNEGKHFVKVDGKRVTETGGESDTLFLENSDEAGRKYDEIMIEKGVMEDTELNFKEDGTRIVYEDVTTATSTTGLGGSASNVVPALSVINIKDLPPDVKPLLRDPRQTSRTGGNSKRHVYAYRGVCRQARKGHDRWQSQISFMGVNHYLGTFDSEWDAAAIYAWAHLILYGEEATRKAQKEGEEAAAAYEQEKKDIAAGKIPAPPPKPEKKKRKPAKKASEKKEESGVAKAGGSKKEGGAAGDGNQATGAKSAKRKRVTKDSSSAEKKPKGGPRAGGKSDKESIAPVLAKGVNKAPALRPRNAAKSITESGLLRDVTIRIKAVRENGFCVTDVGRPPPIVEELRPCVPLHEVSEPPPPGGAMLLGLSPGLFGWDIEVFVDNQYFDSDDATESATAALTSEYGESGVNGLFRTLVQGSVCVIGSASRRLIKASESLGLGAPVVGGSIGSIDCHIGGMVESCSEASACIRFSPTTASAYQFSCLADDDIVTLNGQRITEEMGSFPLFNEDLCTVGSRVFAFLLPVDR